MSFRLIGIVGSGLSVASTLSCFLNFITDKEAGAAGVANFLYFALGELLWRTKDGRDTFIAKDNNNDAERKNTVIYDRATTLLCGATLSLNALICNFICYRQGGNNSHKNQNQVFRVAAWSSIFGAMLLRRWAMLTLGSRFTMALATVKDHQICREGPFRFIRHPGYISNGMMMTAYAFIVTGQPKMVVASALAFLFTWTIRVHHEEKMLKNDPVIGADYQKYCKEVTSKFIPFIY